MATKTATKADVTENINAEAVEEKGKPTRNVLDLLLGADAGVIKMPFRDVEISRLSEVFGEPFIVRCRALTQDDHEDLQDKAIKIAGKDVDLDVNMLQLLTVIESVEAVTVDANGKNVSAGSLLKNMELVNKFKAHTPKELAKMLFLPGEIAKLYNTISQLSGFADGAVKEVKN